MNYTSKFLEYEKNTQRLANLIEGHSAALKFFEKANRFGHNPYNYSTIQNAHKILLETQGISKTLLGLQSIAQQMQEVQKIAGSLGDIAHIATSFDRNSALMPQLQEAQKIAGGLGDIAHIATSFDRNSALMPQLQEAQKIAGSLGDIAHIATSFDRNSALMPQLQEAQKIAGSLGDIAHTTVLLGMNSGLVPQLQEAQRIASQIPFITKLQTKIPQIEPIFIEATKVATSLIHSAPFTVSALSVATASINFSARLDNFPYPEQLRIVDALDSLNLDTDTDIEIPEDLPEEMQSDYVTLIELLQKFCRENENQLLGILTTVETTVKNFSENDFSNPFTVLAFIYNCIILIWNQIKLPKDGDDNNNKD